MRAPRRVPWSSRAEMQELYDMLFSPESDEAVRHCGLARMSLYLSSPSCPTFIPLLHSLLSAAFLDQSPKDPAARHTLRLSLAMALVRFINGMVDPLQTGPYARPIAHLAATLHIPASLISLRHQSTHEDLPPLALLQQGVRRAIEYLHDYALSPMLGDTMSQWQNGESSRHYSGMSGNAKDVRGVGLEQARRLVRRWKRTMKLRLRERNVGEENTSGREVIRIKKDLESLEDEDVAEALISDGGLVPTSEAKQPKWDSTSPSLPSQQLWNPLLVHLQEARPDFADVLAGRTFDAILSPPPDGQNTRWALAVWLVLLWETSSSLNLNDGCKRSIWVGLLKAQVHQDPSIRRLYQALLAVDSTRDPMPPPLGELIGGQEEDLLRGLEEPQDPNGSKADLTSSIEGMERRLSVIETKQQAMVERARSLPNQDPTSSTHMVAHQAPADELPSGWRLLADAEWKPCPIGLWGSLPISVRT